jgi:hypothetical protein
MRENRSLKEGKSSSVLRRQRTRALPRQEKVRGEPSYSIIVNDIESATPHTAGFIKGKHPSPRKWPGMEYRSSLSWFNSETSVRKFRAIPYVSKSGKLSLSTLYFWKSYPEQVIMSLVSTVYRRLLCIHYKRYSSTKRRDLNDLLKISIVYTLTRDNWILDRFLGMSRKGQNKKAVTRFTHYCVSQLDDDKRFVYSQAFQQANWLKFQVFRPSDKSRDVEDCGAHLRNNFKDVHRFPQFRATMAFQISSDLWKVHRLLSMTREETHYASSSGFPDDLSELAREIAGFSEDSD